MPVLPRSLQQLIVDAQQRESYNAADDDLDEIMAGVEDHFARLARGEYSPELYWECQGRDLEEDGQWYQAIQAYQTILDLESSSDFDRFRACDNIAALYRILGDDEAVLKYLKSATRFESLDPRSCLWAGSVVREAWQLVRMGRFADASQRLDQLNESPDTVSHDLIRANLLIARAACRVTYGDARGARQCLREAKALLITLNEALAEHGTENAAGVVGAYSAWWAVEAERCRLVGEDHAELQALRESLKLAEQLASDDPLSIVRAEFRVLHRTLDLAAASDRQDLAEEATEHRSRAKQISLRRKFPHAAMRISSLQPEKPLSVWRRLLNHF